MGTFSAEEVVLTEMCGRSTSRRCDAFLGVIDFAASLTPPAQVLSLIAAKRTWVAKHRATGQLADHFSLAGRSGSGYILAVDSNEELTTIRASDPFAPFSDVEIYPLSDLEEAFDAYEQVMLRVAEAAGS